MLIQYQNELLALALIFILLLLYLILKRKETTTKTEIDEKEEQKVSEQTPLQTKTPNVVQSENISPSHKKIKTAIPTHGKITKEDFTTFKGERILLAEDNIINQKVILGLLGDSGMEIVVANDGQEALDILKDDNDFMLILMDAHMPRVDGFEATKIIKQDPRYNDITIVALSGDIASDDIKKMKEAGMSEHLEKPLKVDALYDILYQYSKKAQNTQTQLVSLDIQKGLQISGNDINFYHDILKEFLSTYSNSAQTLELLLKNNKSTQADQLLLDIIGVSANIGADALTQYANELKDSIKHDNRISIQKYKEELNILISKINDYFLTCK